MSFKKSIILIIIILKSTPILSNSINNDTKKNASFEISIGNSKLKTNEYVYDDYYKDLPVSQLNWKSNTIRVFKSNLNIILPYNFTINFGGFLNLNKAKNSTLNDYDRIPNYYAIFNKLEAKTGLPPDKLDDKVIQRAIGNAHKHMDWNCWSYNHAILDKFYGINFDIQKLIIINDKIKLGLGLGYEKNKSKWYGLGGYGLYVNKKVKFDDKKSIEITNKYKIPYINLQGIFNFTEQIELLIKYKKSFWSSSDNIDYHILRKKKYFDKSSKKNGKYDSLDLKLQYKLTDNLKIFGLYNINKLSLQKTDMSILNIKKNNYVSNANNYKKFENKSGIDTRNYSLSIGIKYDF